MSSNNDVQIPTTDNGDGMNRAELQNLDELMCEGRRLFTLCDYENAANTLSKAAEIAGNTFGDDSEECFDPFFLYGQALLEAAKREENIFSDPEAKPNVDEEDNEGEVVGDHSTNEDNEDSEGEDVEEEDDSMQVSWEMLEICRKICETLTITDDPVKQKKWLLKKADVLMVLGEHSMAAENFRQAHADLQAALDLQSTLLEPTSRVLAQSNHLLGNFHRTEGNFEDAAKFFEKSRDILLAKADELKKQIESCNDDKIDFQTELAEIEALVPDVETLVADAKESLRQTTEVKETLKKEMSEVFDQLKGKSDEPVNDITAMVRRPAKRSGQEDASDESKKTKE